MNVILSAAKDPCILFHYLLIALNSDDIRLNEKKYGNRHCKLSKTEQYRTLERTLIIAK